METEEKGNQLDNLMSSLSYIFFFSSLLKFITVTYFKYLVV